MLLVGMLLVGACLVAARLEQRPAAWAETRLGSFYVHPPRCAVDRARRPDRYVPCGSSLRQRAQDEPLPEAAQAASAPCGRADKPRARWSIRRRRSPAPGWRPW